MMAEEVFNKHRRSRKMKSYQATRIFPDGQNKTKMAPGGGLPFFYGSLRAAWPHTGEVLWQSRKIGAELPH